MSSNPTEIRGMYEGAKCVNGHALEIVSEGYAVCVNKGAPVWSLGWSAWALTKPALDGQFYRHWIRGRDGQDIEAWVSKRFFSFKEEALALIQEDINAHRSRPFDEESERSRLMPV